MSVASLSKSRLERMHRVLTGYVDRQEMPGLVALVSRHDDLQVETLGTCLQPPDAQQRTAW